MIRRIERDTADGTAGTGVGQGRYRISFSVGALAGPHSNSTTVVPEEQVTCQIEGHGGQVKAECHQSGNLTQRHQRQWRLHAENLTQPTEEKHTWQNARTGPVYIFLRPVTVRNLYHIWYPSSSKTH